jgi:hypothetical protein
MTTNSSDAGAEATTAAAREVTIGAPDLEDPIIEDFSPATIEGVATRLANSTSFTELVSRECELDALWTLCDIALSQSTTRTSSSAEGGDREALLGIRTLLGEAVSALSGSHHDEATRLMHEASALASKLP